MKYILYIIFLIFAFILAADENWELKKQGGNFKAYLKDRNGKHYRIEAEFSCSSDSVYNFLTGFERFPDHFDNISSLAILSSNDSVTIHYSVIDAPWPFSDRDMITRVEVDKAQGKTTILSSACDHKIGFSTGNRIRIDDFEEKLEITEIESGRTLLTISGRIRLKEKLPEWLQNRLILSGPVKTIEIINKKYNRRIN